MKNQDFGKEVLRYYHSSIVKRVFKKIEENEEEIKSDIKKLAKIYAPSKNEILRAKYLTQKFREYGIQNVHIDGFGNAIGLIEGDKEGPTVALEGRVAVMPEYYLPKVQKEFPIKKFVIVGALLILVVVIIVVSLLFMRPSQPTIVQQPVTPAEEPPAEAVIPEEPELEDIPPVVEEEEEEEEEEILEEETAQIEIPAVGLADFEIDVDTDQDGLTDGEEQLFGTSAAVPDTDSDSFLDGAEVLNLYDPAAPGALLEVSPLIKIARNDVKGYQMLVPTTWTASMQTPAGDVMNVTPADGTEQITISVYNNEDRLQVVQWYQQQDPTAALTQFENFRNEAGWTGIQSKDSTLVIATFGDTGPGARAFIYVIHYDPGTQALLRYPSIWQMLLNSLAVLEPEDE